MIYIPPPPTLLHPFSINFSFSTLVNTTWHFSSSIFCRFFFAGHYSPHLHDWVERTHETQFSGKFLISHFGMINQYHKPVWLLPDVCSFQSFYCFPGRYVPAFFDGRPFKVKMITFRMSKNFLSKLWLIGGECRCFMALLLFIRCYICGILNNLYIMREFMYSWGMYSVCGECSCYGKIEWWFMAAGFSGSNRSDFFFFAGCCKFNEIVVCNYVL